MNYCPIHSSLYLIASWTQSYRTCNKKRLFLPPAPLLYFPVLSSPCRHAEKRTHLKMKNLPCYGHLHFLRVSCLYWHCKQQLYKSRSLWSWEKVYKRVLILKSLGRMVFCAVCEARSANQDVLQDLRIEVM